MPKLYDYILNKLIKKPEGDMTTGSILYVDENGDLTWNKLDILIEGITNGGSVGSDIGQIQIISTPGHWRIVGESLWNSSGTIIQKPIGEYIIEFSDVNGYEKPNNINITVLKDDIVVHTVNYIEIIIPRMWGNRGIFGGGPSCVIEYITISTTGNASNFANLPYPKVSTAASSNGTRGVFGGGGASLSVIDYITIALAVDSIVFGNLSIARTYLAACSDNTRGIFSGGIINNDNSKVQSRIDYITIAITSNALNFGNLTVSRSYLVACSDGTRGVFGGGSTSTTTSTTTSRIDYITITTLGSAKFFGNLTLAIYQSAACSNSYRGLFGGGSTSGSNTSIIDYITIATTGNAINFGNITENKSGLAACSNGEIGIFGGGWSSSVNIRIDHKTISTLGNAVRFGNLISARSHLTACSGN